MLALLTLALALAQPAEAARLRRHPAIQTTTLQVTSDTRIAVGTQHSASLANLRIGDRVIIGYVQQDGALVAHRIADGVPHIPHTPGTTPGVGSQHHAKAPALLHVHGVIRAINLQAGTITIAHR